MSPLTFFNYPNSPKQFLIFVLSTNNSTEASPVRIRPGLLVKLWE